MAIAAMLGFCGCADAPGGLGAAAAGLHADDDGCPGLPDCEPPGVIVGPNDVADVACFAGQPEAGFAASVGRFRPAQPLPPPFPTICSGVVVGQHTFLTSVSCFDHAPDRGEVVGTIEMGASATTCGGSSTGPVRSWVAKLTRADLGLGVALVRATRELGGNDALGDAYPPVTLSTGETSPSEAIAMVAAQGPGALLRVSPSCSASTWAAPGFYEFGQHDCDSYPGPIFWSEDATGAPLFAYAGAANVPAGAVFAVHLGDWDGSSNAAISVRELAEEGFFDGLDVGP